ncbi:MAG: radical SAM protein [Aeriscardovia sp.]|nr:radical SAM protein [Aeriscardovia sp.]
MKKGSKALLPLFIVMTFEYVCFSITNLCNQSCKYCYRIDSQNEFMDKEVYLSCLKKLKTLGCKMINITGGEPLLHSEWRSFVRIAHEMGFHVVLSSNGLLLDFDDEILNFVDEIAIPLDGSCNRVNALYRGDGHFDSIVGLIEKYKTNKYHFKLKIGTVVTRNNCDDLPAFIPLVENADIFWRLFFCKTKGEYNRISNDELLDRDEFSKLVDKIHEQIPPSVHFLYECSIEDGEGIKETTLISPSGCIYVSDGIEDIFIGDLHSSSVDEILNLVSKSGHKVQGHKLYFNEVI